MESNTSFQKGNVPWNKGKKGIQDAWNKGTKGLRTGPEKHTEETKRKMSEAAKKRPPISEETRRKISEAAKNRGITSPLKGKHHSEESRKKMSLSWRKKRGREVIKKMNEARLKKYRKTAPIKEGKKIMLPERKTKPPKAPVRVVRRETTENPMKCLLSDFNSAMMATFARRRPVPIIYMIRDLVNNKVFVRGTITDLRVAVASHKANVTTNINNFIINQNHIDCQIHTRPHTEFEIEVLKVFRNGCTHHTLRETTENYINQFNSRFPSGYNGVHFSTRNLSLKVGDNTFVPFNIIEDRPVEPKTEPKKREPFVEWDGPLDGDVFMVTPDGMVPFDKDFLIIMDGKGNIMTHYQKVA